MDKQIAERLIEDFFLTEGEIDVEVIGEKDRKELIQKISVALEQVGKQSGAEVLAACITHFEKEAKRCADSADKETGEARAAWNREEARYEDCADDLRELKPVASSLVEHDKETRLKMLAAVCAKLELLRAFQESSADVHQAAGEYMEAKDAERAEYGFRRSLKALEDFQPTAKDLEEYVKNLPLSEIARIKGIPGIAKLGKTYDRPDFYATEDE